MSIDTDNTKYQRVSISSSDNHTNSINVPETKSVRRPTITELEALRAIRRFDFINGFSDPSHLDWKLSESLNTYGINPTPTTMAEHRMTHKKPELFDLIHHWNLTADQKESMDYYQLRTISAGSLGYLLDKDLGRLFDNNSGRTFVPIYQHTSKQQIKIDRSLRPDWTYFLSFRAIKTTNIVLIQRSRDAR